MRNKVPGHISNVQFRNLSVSGAPGPYRVQLEGADEQHEVRDVLFQNVDILGAKLILLGSERLEVGKYTSGLRFRINSATKSGS